jgi:hypothetical protein
MRRSALAALGISLFALCATTLGADLRTADPSAVAPAPTGRHATPARPTDPPAINDKNSAAFVDQFYEELIERTAPWCQSATNDGSRRGHC